METEAQAMKFTDSMTRDTGNLIQLAGMLRTVVPWVHIVAETEYVGYISQNLSHPGQEQERDPKMLPGFLASATDCSLVPPYLHPLACQHFFLGQSFYSNNHETDHFFLQGDGTLNVCADN